MANMYKLEFRPSPPPPPPTMILRRNDDRVPLVMSEDEAFDLYVVLKEHFEGGKYEQEAGTRAG